MISIEKLLGLEERANLPDVEVSTTQKGNLPLITNTKMITQVTTETRMSTIASVSDPDGLNDLSCQNLEDVISEFMPVMEASIVRMTTGNGTHYYVTYDTRGADQAVGILQVYLTLYLIKDCQGLEYPIIRDLFIKHSDLPEPPSIRVSGSPTLSNPPGTFNVTLVNSGAEEDSVISVSVVVSGIRYTAKIDSGTIVSGGGGSLDLDATFYGAQFTAGTSYQIRIAFASGNQLSLQVISSGGGVQNQASQSAIAIETVTFSGTIATVYFRNVGSVSITPALLTAQGISSNFGFRGSVTNSTNLTSGAIAKGAGGSNAMTLSGLTSGDVVTFKITTTAGTFAQGTYTVP